METYSRSELIEQIYEIRNLQNVGLGGNHGEVRTGTQADLRFPRQPQRGQGQAHLGMLVDPKTQDLRNTIWTSLSSQTANVPNRAVNSYRKASQPR